MMYHRLTRVGQSSRAILLKEVSRFFSIRRSVPSPSYWHQPGSEPLKHLTLGQLVEQSARQFGERDAVVALQEGVRMSFGEVLEEADRFAAGLRRLGLVSGDRVALWAPNTWKWITSKFAIARAGLVAVDMNPMYHAEEAAHCLRAARVAAVVAAGEYRGIRYLDTLAKVAPEIASTSSGTAIRASALPDLRYFITLSEEPIPGALRYSDVVSSATTSEIHQTRASQDEISPDHASNILFSSGTTGKPKAIVLTHSNIVNNSNSIGRRLELYKKHHKVCLQVPLFHVFGSVVALSSAFHFGSTIVLPTQGYEPKKSLAAIQSESCTVLTGTPTMHVDLVREVEKSKETGTSLTLAISGGASLTPELARRMQSALGIQRLCSIYGLTETTAVAFQGTRTDSEEQVTDTVGKVGDHVEVKVVDEAGRMVPFGTPGELLVRGYLNMKEYFQNDEATKKTISDGWLRTGDKFVLQEDGYGRVVGRLKDMIIRGGENIYPAEIEAFLTTHPDIIEAQVVGVADERMGEEVCACLRMRAGCTPLSALQLRDFCKGRIAGFKIPRYCVAVHDFPKTLSGKIQKNQLREHCAVLLDKKELDDAFIGKSGR